MAFVCLFSPAALLIDAFPCAFGQLQTVALEHGSLDGGPPLSRATVFQTTLFGVEQLTVKAIPFGESDPYRGSCCMRCRATVSGALSEEGTLPTHVSGLWLQQVLRQRYRRMVESRIAWFIVG